MQERVCTEDEGWPAIVAALGAAQPGDIVRLRPGTYTGSETLRIPSGITLTGEPGVALHFHADAPAVWFQEVEMCSLTDLAIVSTASHIAMRTSPDDPLAATDIPTEWGLVFVERSRAISLSGLVMTAMPRHDFLNAIALRHSYECRISTCRVDAVGADGIRLASSQADIEDNRVSGMRHGILVARATGYLAAASYVRLNGDRCHDNKDAGICLLSSVGKAITRNECWGNTSGIVLQRDPINPTEASYARLEANRCHGNKEAGILLLSSVGETISQNECWGSGSTALP